MWKGRLQLPRDLDFDLTNLGAALIISLDGDQDGVLALEQAHQIINANQHIINASATLLISKISYICLDLKDVGPFLISLISHVNMTTSFSVVSPRLSKSIGIILPIYPSIHPERSERTSVWTNLSCVFM